MNPIASLLILSSFAAAPTDAVGPEAVEIYRCQFDVASDLNWDNWPDLWTRQAGKGYPRYNTIEMAADPDTADPDAAGPDAPTSCEDRVLTMRMDGGAAAVFSPPIEVAPSYSYILSCRMRTEGLTGHLASISLTTLDARHEVRGKIQSLALRGDTDWREVSLGPWATADSEVRFVVIGLHATPEHQGALFGTASFDDLRFARLPRIVLEGQGEFNLYAGIAEPAVTCRVSGIRQSHAEVRFELHDEGANKLVEETVPLTLEAMRDSATTASEPNGPTVYSGIATWRPPLPRAGFYRVSAIVATDGGSALSRQVTLAVIEHRTESRAPGIFGWTIPQGEQHLSLKQWAHLAPLAGLNWVKFPVWFSEKDTELADRIAWFAERMGVLGIEFVGLFANPPAEQARELLGDAGPLPIAMIFREPEVWRRLVNPVMTRLSLKVRWWQLGADHDASYSGYPDLEQHIGQIREHFERFGQESHLTLAWNWLDEKPRAENPPWARLICFAQPSFTPQELSEHLRAESKAQSPSWIVLEPLRSDEHDLTTRVRDLALRMIAAQRDGASAAFVPDPCDERTGLIYEDGSPRELFLPWRTVATQLAGASYLGTVQLPNGSHNCVFARNGAAVLAIWSDVPTTETLFLGLPDQVRQVDLWGRETPLATIDENGHPSQRVEVGPVPTFIAGADLAVARIRLDFAFDKEELSSSFGQEHLAMARFRNHFPQGVSGRLSLHAPREWSVQPDHVTFKAATDEEQTHSFRVFLRANATSGAQPVRIDFDVRSDQSYHFSVYRTIRVGLDDVTFELFASLKDNGDLVVEQQLMNRLEQTVSFNCLLFVPGRPYQRRQVLYADRGRRGDTYIIHDGQALSGQTLWMRAEEIGGGGRILNYQLTVQQ